MTVRYNLLSPLCTAQETDIFDFARRHHVGVLSKQALGQGKRPHRDFLAPEAISEWLRIRTEERGSSINFNRWHPIDAVIKTHADEYETNVEDVEAIRRLLEALDFRPLVTVDRTCEEWKLPDCRRSRSCSTHVVDAGDFVEFEFKGDAENVEDATVRLQEFIASLRVQLGKPIDRGYPHILLGRDH
jgi:adenylate cyclase class 2